MIILSIDSTTKVLSIALSRAGKILSNVSRRSERKYMEMIMDDIDLALRKAHISIRDVDVFGVNAGPGDFTGTRIGISVIKTLGWVLGKKVYGINALDALAYGITSSNINHICKNISFGSRTLVVPCIDVRKGELYYSIYDVSLQDDRENSEQETVATIDIKGKKYRIEKLSGNNLTEADDLLEDIFNIIYREKSGTDQFVIIGGNCFERYEKIISSLAGRRRDLHLDKKDYIPDPVALDECINYLAASGMKQDTLNPVYVRDFVPFGKKQGGMKQGRKNE